MIVKRIKKDNKTLHTKLVVEQKLPNGKKEKLEVTLLNKIDPKDLKSLSKRGVPLSLLPIESDGKLALGFGNFGTAKLVEVGGRLMVAKKIPIESPNFNNLTEEEQAKVLKEHPAYLEHLLSQELIESNVSNVMTTNTLIVDAKHPGGKPKCYQLMDLATLGDGANLTKLLKYLPRDMRDVVITYVAKELLIALKGIHANKIYHRDIKPENILIGHDGTIRLADLGSAAIYRPSTFHPAWNHKRKDDEVNRKECWGFEVSDRTDFDWNPPEANIWRKASDPKESEEASKNVDFGEKVDIWRYGATILKLCGLVKKGEGLLPIYEKLPATIKEIQNYYKKVYEEFQQTLNPNGEAPQRLIKMLLQVLDVKPEKRPSAQKAYEDLDLNKLPTKADVKPAFDILAKLQASRAIITGINHRLRRLYYSIPFNNWLIQKHKNSKLKLSEEEAKKLFWRSYSEERGKVQKYIKDPDLNYETLKTQLGGRGISVTEDQFKVLLANNRLRFLRKKGQLEELSEEFSSGKILTKLNSLNAWSSDEKAVFDLQGEREDIECFRNAMYFALSYSYFFPRVDRHDEILKKFVDLSGKLVSFMNQNHKIFKDEAFQQLKKSLETLNPRIPAERLSITPKFQPPIANDMGEVVEVAETTLHYMRYKTHIDYQRPLDHMEASSSAASSSAGKEISEEEKTLLKAMVDDFLTRNINLINIKGNAAMAGFAANYLYSRDNSIVIQLNSQPYKPTFYGQKEEDEFDGGTLFNAPNLKKLKKEKKSNKGKEKEKKEELPTNVKQAELDPDWKQIDSILEDKSEEFIGMSSVTEKTQNEGNPKKQEVW